MNVKITEKQHKELCKYDYEEYLFGSRLHGIATSESDYDYVRVIPDSFYDNFTTLAKYFPNIHSWQYDGENNAQYVWMTETQFYKNLFSGDGNMIADIVLLSDKWGQAEALKMCRTYKVIKGYLGVGKRDLKLHGNNEKKRFHSWRSIYMALTLLRKQVPSKEGIQNLKKYRLPKKEELFELEKQYREELNSLLNKGEIDMYPNYDETHNSLVQTMVDSNNIREFKYD